MNVANLTAIVLAISAFGSTFLVPYFMRRHGDKRAEAKAFRDNSEVSWVNINLAIAKERDKLQDTLAKQDADHTVEIRDVRERHRREMDNLRDKATETRTRYETEMSSLSTRLADCQKEVSRLYGELYALQKLLPPGVTPGSPMSG